MEIYKCNICNNTFKSKYNLENHKKRAKYCKKNVQEKCEFCNENYINIEQHKDFCYDYLKNYNLKLKNINIQLSNELEIFKTKVDYFENNLSKLEQKNKDLEEQIKDFTIKLIEKPNILTTNNNYSNNKNNTTNNTKIDIFNTLSPLKDSDFVDNAGKLTFEHVKRGVEGYVDYSMEYPLKDKLLCVDYGRKKICYKDENENKIEEYKFDSILPKIFSGINEANNELINTVIDEVDDEFNSKLRMYQPFDEGSKEDKEYSKLQDDNFDIKMKYANMLFDSRNIVKGNLNNKLAKEMSEMLINKIPKK
jgi:hypothetical protein